MIGTTLSHYKVIEKIGQGGMGEVYRAEDSSLKCEVADYLRSRPSYDVDSDGWFLMIKQAEEESTQINVILNWFEELKRLVSTN